MSASLSDTDKGYKRTMASLKGGGRSVVVGVFGAKASENHKTKDPDEPIQTIGDIATQHELGLGVPMRSFLRAYCDQNEAQIKDWLRIAQQQILLGQVTPDQGIARVGMAAVAGMQMFIANGRVQPPLSSYTVKRKGSSTPLIDTGQLKSAITWMIEQKVAVGEGVSGGAEGATKVRGPVRAKKSGLQRTFKRLSKLHLRASRLAKKGGRQAKKRHKKVARKLKQIVKAVRKEQKALGRTVTRQTKAVKKATRRVTRKAARKIRKALK